MGIPFLLVETSLANGLVPGLGYKTRVYAARLAQDSSHKVIAKSH